MTGYRLVEARRQAGGSFVLGWSVVTAIPLYAAMWCWPKFDEWGGGSPSGIQPQWGPWVQAGVIVFVFVVLIVRLAMRRWSLGLAAMRAIVDEDDREEALGNVSDDIDATYHVHFVWVRVALASWFGAVAWYLADNALAAGVIAGVALFFTLFSPHGAKLAARQTWQTLVLRAVEHERSKNPYSDAAPVQRRGRRPISRRRDDCDE